MTERIPEEQLVAAGLLFCRRIAAVLITAMAESGVSLETIEKRARWRKGRARKILNQLIDGSGGDKEVTLRDVAVFAFACDGSVLEFGLERKAEQPVAPVSPEGDFVEALVG